MLHLLLLAQTTPTAPESNTPIGAAVTVALAVLGLVTLLLRLTFQDREKGNTRVDAATAARVATVEQWNTILAAERDQAEERCDACQQRESQLAVSLAVAVEKLAAAEATLERRDAEIKRLRRGIKAPNAEG